MRYSIIVPVFGTEKYIDVCMNSLLKQKVSDYEIILVDDKSPDNCPMICDSYAKQYENVHVVHKSTNEGLGYARNTGIEVASGDFLAFVDSDDTVDEDFLSRIDASLNEDTDILVFGMIFRYEKENGKIVYDDMRKVMESSVLNAEQKVQFFKELYRVGLFNYVCNKLYRREFVIRYCKLFEQTKLIEDFLFNICAFSKTCRIESISDPLYIYRKPDHETLSSQYNPDFFNLTLRKYEEEYAFLNMCATSDYEAYLVVDYGLIKHIINTIIRNHSPKADLGFPGELNRIKIMINHPTIVEMLSKIRPDRFRYKVICFLMKTKQTFPLWIISMMARSIQFGRVPSLKKYIR